MVSRMVACVRWTMKTLSEGCTFLEVLYAIHLVNDERMVKGDQDMKYHIVYIEGVTHEYTFLDSIS